MKEGPIVDTASLELALGEWRTECSIGKGGACPAGEKTEGDGCTPLGRWPIRSVLFRPGRASPPPGLVLPWRWSRASDGWSDDPRDPAYNRPVRLPHAFSAERLQRDDMLYDIVVILGHNDWPPVEGAGSAIFFHLWDETRPHQDRSTQGCVAIARSAMEKLLPQLRSDMEMTIG